MKKKKNKTKQNQKLSKYEKIMIVLTLSSSSALWANFIFTHLIEKINIAIKFVIK